MKNFLRALRYVLPYRRRLVLSIVCALFAAVLWGLNFTAVYPVLKLLTTEQSLQVWIDTSIKNQNDTVDELQRGADDASAREDALKEGTKNTPDGPQKDKILRDASAKSLKAQTKLESARRTLYYQQILQKYIHLLLPTDCFSTLVFVVIAVVVAMAVKGIFEFLQETLVASVVNKSLFDLRNRFYRNSIHLDVNQFNEEGTGELMARFTNDVEMLGTGQKTLFERVIAEPLRALSCIVVACLINWQLTLLFLVLVPIALLVLTKIGRLMKRATHRLLERMSSIYKILQESFKGIRVVKAFTMEPHERRRFHEATKDYYVKSMRVAKLNALASPVIEVLGMITIGAALLVGAHLVLRPGHQFIGLKLGETMEAETLLQLYVLLAAIADPVRKLSSVYTKLQSGFAAADRIFAVMDRQPRVGANSDQPRLTGVKHSVEFRDLSFSYDPTRPILTNINLTVQAGEVVAFVGKNGCGKSTLLGLIPRFYDPDHGGVLIDGTNIRQLNLRSLRTRIGIVTQDAILFDETIYNNIAYGNRKAGPEQVEEAARKAGAHDFISRLPHGYQTRMGEAGSKMAGGEKQRIALARAILRDPDILILDEFTSQIDADSEMRIHRAVKEFVRGRTTFLITHRLNTLEIADRIVVLDEGRIVALGTHPELLAMCPLYSALYEASVQKLVA